MVAVVNCAVPTVLPEAVATHYTQELLKQLEEEQNDPGNPNFMPKHPMSPFQIKVFGGLWISLACLYAYLFKQRLYSQ
eukprot:g73813.t1